MDNRPIGVLDSGFGGLSVVKELRKILPSEDVVYLDDIKPHFGRRFINNGKIS